MQITPENAAGFARDYLADGFTIDDYLNDETFECDVCEARFPFADRDAQIEAWHPSLKFVCACCADPILARWVAS